MTSRILSVLAVVLGGVLLTISVINHRIHAIEARSLPDPRPIPAVAAAPTDAEVAADLAHCVAIAKTMRTGLGAIVYGISTSDAGWLAQSSDVTGWLSETLAQDKAPAPIQSLALHRRFMTDAAGASALMAQLSEDAANFLAGGSNMKFTDLRHEALLTEAAANAVNRDLQAYQRFVNLSHATP